MVSLLLLWFYSRNSRHCSVGGLQPRSPLPNLSGFPVKSGGSWFYPTILCILGALKQASYGWHQGLCPVHWDLLKTLGQLSTETNPGAAVSSEMFLPRKIQNQLYSYPCLCWQRLWRFWGCLHRTFSTVSVQSAWPLCICSSSCILAAA